MISTNKVLKIVANVFVQLIILLYLVDNNENTSWMILMGQGVGMVIEAWKVNDTAGLACSISDDYSHPRLQRQLISK